MNKKRKGIAAMLLVMGIVSGCADTGQTVGSAEPAGKDTAGTIEKDAPGEDMSGSVELVIESWRADDLTVWEDIILPEYTKTHPDVTIQFNGVVNTEYGTTLTTKLQADTAGDIIMVEPYDYRVSLYQEGYLANLNEIDSLDADTQRYEAFALSAWSTDEGDLFAVPLAACTHGFIYNKDKFDAMGWETPETTDAFFALCEAIQKEGFTPLAFGTGDDFVGSVYAFSNIAPNFVKGEEGRQGLVKGTKKFTDEEFVSAWKFLEKWIPYMPDGYQAISYSDMQNLFVTEQALIFPAGSWDVSVFNNMVGDAFQMGAFEVPVENAGDERYVCNHPDMGLALNADSPNRDAAVEFLQWTTTQEFAELWNNSLPGFFTLSKNTVTVKDPLAAEMLSWASSAGNSPRIAYQYLSRGAFNTDAEIIRLTNLMFAGEITAEEAAKEMQAGFEASYKPVSE